MAAKQHRVAVTATGDNYEWTRVSNNGAVVGKSHRSWDTPGLAVKNAVAVNKPPYLLVTPKEKRPVTE
ncbi:hypothetical protein CH276_22585 [Rhodococcus sp. 06-470-2]|uniref:hypothetical protein n=1 Tax=unclassified Rhodococcus (in: high G+C Gram-positive bacteria) TaxID=192944 RepID=UPI000B9AC45F|nr:MULTISPECIES: hypothetical protein [unclassified Rhodococcus (in: high G+C Gram-positive bacteria)]OZC59238.1 hypothetical protein CH276_22585 [Rhodococcus sp. 06-470-2]OZE66825.1 hypothetical protein CH265_07910 [Rhodococcus sp. 05-2221-1B]